MDEDKSQDTGGDEAQDSKTSETEIQHHSERQWRALTIYLLLALAVAVIVVFGGRWLYHQVHHNKPVNKPIAPSTNKTPQPPTASNNGQNNQGTSSPNASQPSTSTQTGTVPNTGPGNVISIFVGTAVLVGGLHYIIQLRKGA